MQNSEEPWYKDCECGDGVEILKTGFEFPVHMCAVCSREVADAADFHKTVTGVEVLAK